MKIQLQLTLLIAAVLYVAWGLALLFVPVLAHDHMSAGPFDPASTALFAVALLGFAVAFLIGARDPAKAVVGVATVGLALLGLTAAFLMFVSKMMPMNALTLMSLVVDLAAGAMLFLAFGRMEVEAKVKTKSGSAPRRGSKAMGRARKAGYSRS